MADDLPGFSQPIRTAHTRNGAALSAGALILGIGGIVTSFAPPVSLVLVVAGVTFGLLALRYPQRKRAIFALTCCGFAILFSGVASVLYDQRFVLQNTAATPASNPFAAGNIYYYDLTTGELVAGPLSWTAYPVNNHYVNGYPAGLPAKVFSCGDCSDPKQRRIAYLQTYAEQGSLPPTPPVGATTMHADPSTPTTMPGLVGGTAYSVYVIDGSMQGGWHEMNSDEGGKIVANALAPCPGQMSSPTPCTP